MYPYRQVLVRMRQGDSDREMARSRLMGRKKIAQLRVIAQERGWLAPEAAFPEDAVLATLFPRREGLPRWAKVKVHRDAHVQFAQYPYSVPCRLVGQTLWLKASDTLIRLYQDHAPVACHPRQSRPGARVTLPDHLPPEALAWSLHDTQWCLQQAERIGPHCHTLIHTLFADRVLVHRRAAQGLLRLEGAYGAARLEAACARALDAGSPRYRTVKTILAKNLDQGPARDAATPLPATYPQGGRFCRDPQTALH
jgi:hypothetical protein